MLKTGVLNPQLASLLARLRHTNTLVIADRGFPSWPGVETVDLSLVDGVPAVLQVLEAIRANCVIGQAYMASQFRDQNTAETRFAFARALEGIPLNYEDHESTFKPRVPAPSASSAPATPPLTPTSFSPAPEPLNRRIHL